MTVYPGKLFGAKNEISDSCPVDNLNNLKLSGEYEKFRYDPALNGALDLLLRHWERGGEGWQPYGFGIGTDYVKLRYPDIKYGILRLQVFESDTLTSDCDRIENY